MLLAGDIGGTKTLLGIFDPAKVRPRPIVVRSFGTLDYDDLPTMIAAFLKDDDMARVTIDTACFGVAGPVVGESATMTNIPWRVDARRVRSAVGFRRGPLLHDLEALAYSVTVLADVQVHVLCRGARCLRRRLRRRIGHPRMAQRGHRRCIRRGRNRAENSAGADGRFIHARIQRKGPARANGRTHAGQSDFERRSWTARRRRVRRERPRGYMTRTSASEQTRRAYKKIRTAQLCRPDRGPVCCIVVDLNDLVFRSQRREAPL